MSVLHIHSGQSFDALRPSMLPSNVRTAHIETSDQSKKHMASTIKYGKNFNDTLHKILKTRTYENITLKCTYPEYFSIILNNTPLPEVLINIICE